MGAWGFNEGSGTTAADSSGSGNNGTLSGAGATWTPGRQVRRRAVVQRLVGQGTVPHSASISLSSSYTLEAWVKPSALSGYETVLIKEVTGGCGYWLQTSGNQHRQRIQQRLLPRVRQHHPDDPAQPVVTPRRRLQRRRQHLHAVPERNGDPDRHRDHRARPQHAGAGVRPVRLQHLRQRTVGGLLDDIRVYNRALSAAEIQADRDTAVP